MPKHLKISALLAEGDPPTVDRGRKPFEVQINPAEFNFKRSICYNSKPTLGQPRARPRFSAVGPDEIDFALVFDGTGAVPESHPVDVIDRLNALNDVVYKYEGKDHQPSEVRIAWGTLILDGRMKSMDTQFTLFRADGAPLRARVSLSFVGVSTNTQANLSANRSSPDLSHRVVVRDGDTLPLLCLRIYGDASYYPQVAAFNGLTGFRRLPPGLQLHFPPLG